MTWTPQQRVSLLAPFAFQGLANSETSPAQESQALLGRRSRENVPKSTSEGAIKNLTVADIWQRSTESGESRGSVSVTGAACMPLSQHECETPSFSVGSGLWLRRWLDCADLFDQSETDR